jgi:PIN domain nuclease of toxin-antitoxin system
LIVATAQVEDMTVVTSDGQFRLYNVPLVDARS